LNCLFIQEPAPECKAHEDSGAPAQPFITRDVSESRELMHPAVHGASHGVACQSLAEATVLPGQKTHAAASSQTRPRLRPAYAFNPLEILEER